MKQAPSFLISPTSYFDNSWPLERVGLPGPAGLDCRLCWEASPQRSTSVKSRDITHTVINGRIVYLDGRLQLTNQDAVFDEGKRLAREWVRRNLPILERAGVAARLQPHVFDGEHPDQAAPERPLLIAQGEVGAHARDKRV